MKNLARIFIFITALSLAGCNFSVTKQNTEALSRHQVKKYGRIFKDLKNTLIKEDAKKLWNHPIYGPLIFVNPKNRIAIANEPDKKGFLIKNGSVYTGVLPKQFSIANSTVDWGGKTWAMVMLPLPEDYYAASNLIIHELFHRIQPNVGFADLQEKSSNHLDEMNGRIYLKLELEALKQALKSNNQAERQEYIHDALLFRLYRYSLYPDAKEDENYLELKEGLAEYTGSILSGRTQDEMVKHYVYAINTFYQNQTFVRSFAYVTIPTYGYLMSLQDKYWNRKVTEDTNLTDFMLNFFHVRAPSDLKSIIERIRNDYGYNEILAYEMKRNKALKKEMAAYETRFIKNPTLIIRLQKMHFRFDPRTSVPFKDLGTIYPTMRVVDTWGILNVTKGGGLIADWKKVVVSAPIEITDSLVKGEGWTIELNKGWKVVKDGKNYTLKMK